MTNIRTSNLSTIINSLNRVALGFEPVFHDIEARWTNTTSNYPPYNVVKHQDGAISLEIAVAGFKQREIEIEQHQSKLTVSGKKEAVSEEFPELTYQHKGISARTFKLVWTLAEHMEVTTAKLEDGILTIALVQHIPEENKPKLIEIAKSL